MTIKEKIEEIIKTEPIVKEAYENNGGCFKNIIIPAIENNDSDDGVLYDLITMLALQCSLYDTVLNNIAGLGSKELITKCKIDINTITTSLNEE